MLWPPGCVISLLVLQRAGHVQVIKGMSEKQKRVPWTGCGTIAGLMEFNEGWIYIYFLTWL